MSDDAGAPPPVTLSALAKVFLVVGCTAFGGGAAAHIREAVVRRHRWVDERTFIEGMTVARIAPGPNISNIAAFVGALLCGRSGAAVAVAAVNVPGALVVLGLAAAYERLLDRFELVGHALHGLTAAAIGLMVSMVAQQARPALGGRGAPVLAALAFLGVGALGLPLVVVLAALLPAGVLLGWREERP